MSQKNRRVKIYLVVLVLYLLLAVLMTYPLITQMTTHVPGDGRDDPPLVWNLWWVRHALVDLHTNPLLCDYLFFPIGINLTYFTLMILNGMLSIPLQVGGIVLASNIELLMSYALSGLGAYLLALSVLAGQNGKRAATPSMHLAAFTAGLVYAFAPIKMIFASIGQFNMTSTQWLPFCVLYVLRATRPLRSVGRVSYPASGPQQNSSGMTPDLQALRSFIAGFFPAADGEGRRDALLAALFLLFTAYAEFTFASFLGIFIVVYLLYLAITRRTALTRRMAGRMALLGLAFLVGLWPILGSMLRQMAIEGDYSLTAGWGFADIFIADLLGFFVPSHLHPIFGSFAAEATRAFSYTNFASSGVIALLLALLGIVLRRSHAGHGRPADAVAGAASQAVPASFWGWSTLLYAVLSLGPALHIGGRWVFDLDGLIVRLPLPFIILHYIPFIKANRYPSRLQVLVVLSLAMLVAYGVQAVLERTRINAEKARIRSDSAVGHTSPVRENPFFFGSYPRSRTLPLVLSGIVCAAIVFEYLPIPLPMSDMRIPAVYARIAQDNGGAPILQLPLSWRNSFQFIPQKMTDMPLSVNTVVMFQQFYQTTHGGPILSGNTSRNPEFKINYFLEAPVVSTIVAIEEGRPVSAEQVAHDRSLITETLRFFGFRYVVLHPPYAGGPLEDYVRAVFPVEAIPADSGLSAYHVTTPTPASSVSINLSDNDMSNLYRAEGWGEPQMIDGRMGRWTDRNAARLLVPLNGPEAVQLTVEWLHGPLNQGVAIALNGHSIAYTDLMAETWETRTLTFPAGVAHAGLNELTFERSDLLASGGPRGPESGVGQTAIQTRANIVAHSAGLDAGGDMGFAHIYVNGKDVISGRRGINVAVIDAASGAVERTARFDLLGDAAAGDRLLDFVKATLDGRIVAVAVMDDASINFGDSGAAALRLIGAQGDLRGRLRNSYAAIGVKGATPGQALEEWRQGRPASVAVGPHIFGKGLGVAVGKIVVEQ